jgi:hypothetical protein
MQDCLFVVAPLGIGALRYGVRDRTEGSRVRLNTWSNLVSLDFP